MSERSLHPSILILLIAVLFLLCPGTVQASYLSISVRDDRVHLRAEEVPLIDVVTGLCEKSGIILKSGDPMTEPVSLELKGLSLETCFRRLLTRRNYALIYEGKGDDQFVLVSLRVLGAGAVVSFEPEPPTPLADDPIKRYEKESFVRMFGDSSNPDGRVTADGVNSGLGTDVQMSGDSSSPGEPVTADAASSGPGTDVQASAHSRNLSSSVSADEVSSSPVPDDMGGIRLTRIPKESVLAQIGLEAGDIVRDVNGRPVNSTDELIESLKNPPPELPTIRIERLRRNGQIDPIYIELH